VRFEPSARVLRDVGFDFMSEEHQREIVAQSFLDGGRVIAAHAEALAPLRRRRIAAVS
jgi:hypothetical protein